MSLNQSEQMIFDYVQRHPDERHYWVEKVRKTSQAFPDDHAAASSLEPDLWRYFQERSGVVSPFKEFAQSAGLRRVSMKNLAEYMLRLWVTPRPKKPTPRAVEESA
jgi:hypothetical protein